MQKIIALKVHDDEIMIRKMFYVFAIIFSTVVIIKFSNNADGVLFEKYLSIQLLTDELYNNGENILGSPCVFNYPFWKSI